jgi:nucleotide-binding universal stress UspA family protein
MAWEYPSIYGVASHGMMLPPEDDFAGAAHATVKDLLAAAGSEGVEIIENVVAGAPAPVLIEASKGADLLVVGSRGRGAFAGMLLGSVSQHCVSHAECPVLVVLGPADAD